MAQLKINLDQFEITGGENFKLKNFSTSPDSQISKSDSKEIIEENVQSISEELDLRKNTVWNYKSKVIEAIELNRKHKSSDEFITHVILNPAE